MKVIVSGGWSYGNIGDEVIAKITKYELNRIWPDADFVFLSYDPKEFYKHQRIDSRKSVHRLISEQTKYKINKNNVLSLLDELKEGVLSSYTDLFNEKDSVFVMSGGGYFVESWEDQFLSRIIEINIAYSMNAKIILIGQSIGPFYTKTAKRLAANAFKLCSYINVRDDSSYKLIKELDSSIKAGVSCDMANDIKSFYKDKLYSKEKCSEKLVISLMISTYSNHEQTHNKLKVNGLFMRIVNRITLRKYIYEYKIKKLLKDLSSKSQYQVQIVMSTNWKWDENFAKRIARNTNVEIINGITVDDLCRAIVNSDYMISSKMHPLIIANSYCIPTIGISYNFKMDDFMKTIDRSDYCYINRNLDTKRIIDQIDNSIGNKEGISETSDKLSAMVVSMFQEVKTLLIDKEKES